MRKNDDVQTIYHDDIHETNGTKQYGLDLYHCKIYIFMGGGGGGGGGEGEVGWGGVGIYWAREVK